MASASNTKLAHRLEKFLKSQLDVLKEESGAMTDAMEDFVNEMQLLALKEMDQWTCTGQVNKLSFREISKNIQQAITFVILKNFELSELHKYVTDGEAYLDSESTSTPMTPSTEITPPTTVLHTEKLYHKSDKSGEVKDFESMTKRITKLEENVFSMKKTTEDTQDRAEIADKTIEEDSFEKENVDKDLNDVYLKLENIYNILKDFSKKQENDRIEVVNLSNTHLKFKKQILERILDLEKINKEYSSNVDYLHRTVTNADATLNRLEDENKYVNVSINELNQQISSVRICSHDALMSIQDLSKSVENTNQHYNEMSNKVKKLKTTMTLYIGNFEKASSIKKDEVEDLFGMVCHLLARKVTLLEQLRANLNTIITTEKRALKLKEGDSRRIDRVTKIRTGYKFGGASNVKSGKSGFSFTFPLSKALNFSTSKASAQNADSSIAATGVFVFCASGQSAHTMKSNTDQTRVGVPPSPAPLSTTTANSTVGLRFGAPTVAASTSASGTATTAGLSFDVPSTSALTTTTSNAPTGGFSSGLSSVCASTPANGTATTDLLGFDVPSASAPTTTTSNEPTGSFNFGFSNVSALAPASGTSNTDGLSSDSLSASAPIITTHYAPSRSYSFGV